MLVFTRNDTEKAMKENNSDNIKPDCYREREEKIYKKE